MRKNPGRRERRRLMKSNGNLQGQPFLRALIDNWAHRRRNAREARK
jgi:hypothetical protein